MEQSQQTKPNPDVVVQVQQPAAAAPTVVKVPVGPKRRIEQPEWRRRRLRLDLSLAFLGACLIYVLLPGGQEEVDKVAVIPLIAGMVALVGQYIFGAAWDSKNYMNAISRQNETYSYPFTEEERTNVE